MKKKERLKKKLKEQLKVTDRRGPVWNSRSTVFSDGRSYDRNRIKTETRKIFKEESHEISV